MIAHPMIEGPCSRFGATSDLIVALCLMMYQALPQGTPQSRFTEQDENHGQVFGF